MKIEAVHIIAICAIITVIVVIIGAVIKIINVIGAKREWKGRIETKISGIEKDITELKEGQKELKVGQDRLLEHILNRKEQFYTGKKNPIELKESGKELLEMSGFNKIFIEIKDGLIEKIKEKNPKNEYQIQRAAKTLMISLINNPRFESLQDYVYKNPEVSVELILWVGAIPLRDYYLEKHPEIKE